jgi:hypothetical protein
MKPLDKLITKIDPLFKSPAFDAAKLPAGLKLAPAHRQLLEKRNGGYYFGGALHLFGACSEPAFHSLIGWNAAEGWRAAYGEAVAGLTFFAEDAFGDQFGLDSAGKVFVLRSEQGVVEEIADDFDQWLLMAVEAPDELLSREMFVDWVKVHGHLPHGSHLQAFPPFVFETEQVEIDVVDAFENMAFHASLAQTLQTLPEGMQIEITDEGIQIVPAEEAPAPEGEQG